MAFSMSGLFCLFFYRHSFKLIADVNGSMAAPEFQ